MSHDIQETVLGKRKRQEGSSTSDKPQARIDHYFATKAPVNKPSNGNGHADVSDNMVHTVQVRCGNAAVSQVGLRAVTSQAHSPRQCSQQTPGCCNLTHQREEQTSCAADHQVAGHASPAAQGENLPGANSGTATAFKTSSKPKSAVRNALQLPHAVPKPPAAATTQPDLAEHLSFFLAVLPERQQFRE